MEIFTVRLELREFCQADYVALFEINTDPENKRYEGPVLTAEQIQSRLDWILAEQEKTPRRNFRIAISLPCDGRLRGWITLGVNNESIREYEIGWMVRWQDWGQGYATEAARAVLEYAFGELGAHRVTAFCHAGNRASERVMQKLGMRREGLLRQTRLLNGKWGDEMVYAILEGELGG